MTSVSRDLASSAASGQVAVRSARSSRRPVDKLLVLAGVICALLMCLAVFGSLLAPYPADQTDILAASQGPSAEHLLGTDSLGRDILTRALVGARLSFAGPLLVVLGCVVLGTALALFAAWNGGWVDRALNRVLNVMFAVPGILVAVLASAVFGAGFWAPVIALALVYTPYAARVIRSAAVRERNMPYIEGLQLAGISSVSINLRHILRNIWPLILAQSTIAFGTALADFAAVSFIGLGIQPPAAEWGLMVADGRSEMLDGAFQQSLVAGLCIVLTVVSFNVLGDRLTARFGATR
jgi:peptide/nickel transport system permease protein